jgi:hypothetical protein
VIENRGVDPDVNSGDGSATASGTLRAVDGT